MAEQLVRQGVPMVLGWGRPVLDRSATMAATHLYERLAEGFSVAEALSSNYRYLLQKQIPDWHLLRLYGRGGFEIPLVEEPGDDLPPLEPVQLQFLDPERKVRVATPDQFVGRRRILQRCLRQLRSRNNLGVVLHGIGGVGKSTIAARLLERLPDYQPLVVYRELDEAVLVRLLAQQCTSEQGHQILQENQPWLGRLQKFLDYGLNSKDQKFCFVLDDFEANLEADSDGAQQLQAQVVEPLRALLEAVSKSKVAHRVLITSRYDVKLPPDWRLRSLHREMVPALRGAELQKKYERLSAFSPDSQVGPALQEQAKWAADGNPRLLEWLNKLLLAGDVDTGAILPQIAAKAAEFREAILAEVLLAQQSEALKQLLARGLVYELPVPEAAMMAVWDGIPAVERQRQRAIDLGLLEAFPLSQTPVYRVPRLLAPLLPNLDPALLPAAATTLYRLWWQASETSTEEQRQEMHRLALAAGQAEIAAEIGSALAHRWYSQSRFREAVELCQNTLAIAPDYRIYHSLARSETPLGQVSAALAHYQQALETCPEAEVRERATILHNSAGIYAQQGQVEQALSLYQQSLQAEEAIGDVRGKAATLANMAYLAGQQGDLVQQLQLNLQAAEALARIRAYPDLVTVLSNLGTSAPAHRLVYLAQALWLGLRIQLPFTDKMDLLHVLFQAVPRADALEPLLATTALLLCQIQGKDHPHSEQWQQQALKMIVYAVQNQGVNFETEADLQAWLTEAQLNDPEFFLPRLSQQLEALVGEQWLFDRRAFG